MSLLMPLSISRPISGQMFHGRLCFGGRTFCHVPVSLSIVIEWEIKLTPMRRRNSTSVLQMTPLEEQRRSPVHSKMDVVNEPLVAAAKGGPR